jgi:hypothetical protein
MNMELNTVDNIIVTDITPDVEKLRILKKDYDSLFNDYFDEDDDDYYDDDDDEPDDDKFDEFDEEEDESDESDTENEEEDDDDEYDEEDDDDEYEYDEDEDDDEYEEEDDDDAITRLEELIRITKEKDHEYFDERNDFQKKLETLIQKNINNYAIQIRYNVDSTTYVYTLFMRSDRIEVFDNICRLVYTHLLLETKTLDNKIGPHANTAMGVHYITDFLLDEILLKTDEWLYSKWNHRQ